jgi:hypothetical protein
MRRVGQVASYPARLANLPLMLEGVAPQLDEVHVVLNQFTKAQLRRLPKFGNVEYVIPSEDLKDVGKFARACGADEYVFLMDDDLLFPPDYVANLVEWQQKCPSPRMAIGLHGVVYSDLFEGASASRFVAKFDKALRKPMLVNQLGTGCLMIRGDLMPDYDYMASSQRFVDVRFARHCHERGIGMLCISREAGWVKDQDPEESIFESYTRERHGEQTQEILEFAGFGKLNAKLALAVERL